MAQKNKVKFNIKNVHIAARTSEGAYGTPFALPGAVSIALEAQGELTPFYADGVKYYVASSNNGYEGDLEVALVTDEFRQQILGDTLNSDGVLVENSNTNAVEFALGFDIDGDKGTTSFWFYNCTATRPSTESSTTETAKNPTTDTITINCAGDNGVIRSKTTDTTDEETVAAWYTTVYVPA